MDAGTEEGHSWSSWSGWRDWPSRWWHHDDEQGCGTWEEPGKAEEEQTEPEHKPPEHKQPEHKPDLE